MLVDLPQQNKGKTNFCGEIIDINELGTRTAFHRSICGKNDFKTTTQNKTDLTQGQLSQKALSPHRLLLKSLTEHHHLKMATVRCAEM